MFYNFAGWRKVGGNGSTGSELPMNVSATDRFTVEHAAELYGVDRWGNGYLSIREDGHLLVNAEGEEREGIDLHQVVQTLAERGLRTPVLLRFPRLLEGQLNELAAAVERGVVAAGQPPDSQGFRAHLTVGRLRGHGYPALHDESGLIGSSFVVDRVVLMRSDLRAEGAVYSELESIPLPVTSTHAAE